MIEKSWINQYNLGKALFDKSDVENDIDTIDALEEALRTGLNVFSNIKAYEDALKMLAILLFRRQDYDAAINYLGDIIDATDDIPDWVHTYLAEAEIESYLDSLADDPSFLHDRLDCIDESNKNEVKRRENIYRDFLNRLSNGLGTGFITAVDSEKIILKSIEYKLNNTDELKAFHAITHSTINIPPLMVEMSDDTTQLLETLRAELLEKNRELEETKEKLKESRAETLKIKQIIADKDETIKALAEENVKHEEALEEVKDIETQIHSIEIGACNINSDAFRLLARNQQILVISGMTAKKNDLEGIVKSYGFNKEQFEFVLDYNKIKKAISKIVPYDSHYAAIIVGSMPHKTEESGDYSSAIEMLKNEDGYPYIVEARETSGKMKLSKTAFRKALDQVLNHLNAIPR